MLKRGWAGVALVLIPTCLNYIQSTSHPGSQRHQCALILGILRGRQLQQRRSAHQVPPCIEIHYWQAHPPAGAGCTGTTQLARGSDEDGAGAGEGEGRLCLTSWDD
eukprot:1160470-Pelagomonas_calceolata.AAC.5